MESEEAYKAKIQNQLAKWKSTIDGLKVKFEQAEADAKAILQNQIESLHDKRVKAEKLLEDVSATSQDAWEQIKSGMEQGWNDITRTAKKTVAKVREAIEHPHREEEIRRIAYHLWLDEGCPHSRHLDHWFKAESIWHARQAEATQPGQQPPANTKRPRKKTATPAIAKRRATKTNTRNRSRSINRGVDKT
jgi:hypothetical protein